MTKVSATKYGCKNISVLLKNSILTVIQVNLQFVIIYNPLSTTTESEFLYLLFSKFETLSAAVAWENGLYNFFTLLDEIKVIYSWQKFEYPLYIAKNNAYCPKTVFIVVHSPTSQPTKQIFFLMVQFYGLIGLTSVHRQKAKLSTRSGWHQILLVLGTKGTCKLDIR